MQDDDFSLFKNELRGVKPIKHDRADTGKPKTDRAQIAKLRQAATVRTDATTVDGLSDQFVIDVGPEDELMWARDGVQESQMRKLKAGQIPFEGSLDLHGMNVEKARETLWAFLAEATKFEIRCELPSVWAWAAVSWARAARTAAWAAPTALRLAVNWVCAWSNSSLPTAPLASSGRRRSTSSLERAASASRRCSSASRSATWACSGALLA